MAMIIYSSLSGRIRRIINDPTSSPQDMEAMHPRRTNEVSAHLPMGAVDTLQGQINAITGKTPIDSRYAVINADGDVTNVISCEPELGDSVEGHTLVESPVARIGWRQMLDGSFQRSLAEIDRDKAILVAQRARSLARTPVADDGSPKSTRDEYTQAEIDIRVAMIEAKIGIVDAESAARELTR
jgi:hypothetical protein